MSPPNAGLKFPAEVYSREQIDRLLRAMGRGFAGDRDRAATVILWRCGLRVAEMIALYPRDVDLRAGTVTIRHGKGNRRRVVGIDSQAGAVVERWLERRRLLGLDGRHALFCVISRPTLGKPMYASVYREKLKDAARAAGLAAEGVRVHPHGFRHTFASELAREGKSITVIRALLGHASIATTARYIDHLTPWEAIDAARGRVWPSVNHPAPIPLADAA